MTLPTIKYDDPMEQTPQTLYWADISRLAWDAMLPTMWFTPEDIDLPRVIPIYGAKP